MSYLKDGCRRRLVRAIQICVAVNLALTSVETLGKQGKAPPGKDKPVQPEPVLSEAGTIFEIDAPLSTTAKGMAGAETGSTAGTPTPFFETFEGIEDGAFDGMNGWDVTPAGAGTIQRNIVHRGDKAAGLRGGAMVQRLDGGKKATVWLDFHARPVRCGKQPSVSESATAAFWVDQQGRVVVLSKKKKEVTLENTIVPEDAWTRFTLKLDYKTSKWDLYAADGDGDGAAGLVAEDLHFGDSKAKNIQSFHVRQSGSASNAYVDSIGASEDMPLCIDNDGDGMPDSVELAYFGNTEKSDGVGDSDGDGLTDFEEYITGMNPNSENSRFGISECDVSGESGSDVTLQWTGRDSSMRSGYPGDTRVRHYTIRAADNDAAVPKTALAAVADTPAGQDSWTDEAAVECFASRFYEISVALGEAAYTNSEEWAMFTRERKSNSRSLIALPVDFGDENTLDGKLGSQLARGLCAGGATNEADSIILLTKDKSWKQYFLVKDKKGRAYWWDPDTKRGTKLKHKQAVRIEPGTPFWLVCGPGERTDGGRCVFTGRSFQNAPSVDISVGNGGWNTFGWVCSRSLRHRNTESAVRYSTPANQLGLAAIGVGGRTSDQGRPHETGDQIWVWEDDTWKHIYWLIGAPDARWNGKWWNSHEGDFADFKLEPGRGYYYRHSTNYGGTNFTWHPKP